MKKKQKRDKFADRYDPEPLKKNDEINEDEVVLRINAGITHRLRFDDDWSLVELYNLVAYPGSGKIEVIEDEGGDVVMEKGLPMFRVCEETKSEGETQ